MARRGSASTGNSRYPARGTAVTMGDYYRGGGKSAFGGGTVRQMGRTRTGNAKSTVVGGTKRGGGGTAKS